MEQKQTAVTSGETVVVDDDEQPRTPPMDMQEEKRSFFQGQPAVPSTAATSSAAASSAMPSSGLEVPTTPRAAPTTRMHGAGTEEEQQSKKARVEDVKRQRIERIVAEHEKAVRAVKISEKEVFHTMDESTCSALYSCNLFSRSIFCNAFKWIGGAYNSKSSSNNKDAWSWN